MAFYVSEYDSDLRYGGPEEGGWHYQWHTFKRTVAVFGSEADALKDCRKRNMNARFSGAYDKNMDSGATFWIESVAGENATTHRPHYE